MSGQRQGAASFKPKNVYGARAIEPSGDGSALNPLPLPLPLPRPWYQELHPRPRPEAARAVQAQQADQQVQHAPPLCRSYSDILPMYKKLRAALTPETFDTTASAQPAGASAPVHSKPASSATAAATKQHKQHSAKPNPFMKAQKEFVARQAAAEAERAAKERAHREQQQQRQDAIDRRQSQRDDMRSRTKKGQPVMSRSRHTAPQRKAESSNRKPPGFSTRSCSALISRL